MECKTETGSKASRWQKYACPCCGIVEYYEPFMYEVLTMDGEALFKTKEQAEEYKEFLKTQDKFLGWIRWDFRVHL